MKKHIATSLAIWAGLVAMPAQADDYFLGKSSSSEREAVVHGHEDGLMNWPGISGTWGGQREKMSDHGVTLEAIYTGEFAKNFTANPVTANGLKKTVYQTNTDLTLTLDTQAAEMWSGGTFFIYGLGNTGGNPTDYTGDLQGYTNIEAPNQWIVYEAWYEQQFADGMFSILAGLHDMNSEFYVTEYGSLFLNSSFGIGPDLTGNVPASIFPKAALGVRVHIHPSENSYVQAAMYDGDSRTRTFKSAEGKLWVAETGFSSDSGTYKLGYWQHTADKTFDGNTFSNDYGLYAVIDQELVQLDGHGMIGGFLQYGYTPKSRNEIYTYIGAGLHLHGLMASRVEDDLGIAVASAYFHASLNAQKVSERAVELTYRLVVTPWFAVQPSLQWIKNPGGDSAAPAVKAGLLRFEITL
ncbi:MAG: carbohydrate porin [Mariprofundaceae bacterium]|nr:carbohydrate porin [Mariprofundaceae bacterium]